MDKIENEWKRVRMGFNPATPPLQIEMMRTMFVSGVLATFKTIVEAKPEDFPAIKAEIERMAYSTVEKGKLVKSIEDAIMQIKPQK